MNHIKVFITVAIILLGYHTCCLAQQEDKLGVSVSFGVGYFGFLSSGGVYGDNGSVTFVDEPEKQSQINLNGDVALSLDSYIFSLYFGFGLVDPIPYKQANYAEYNLTIGKEFIKNDWFGLEGHLGVGYFETKERFAPNGPEESFGTVGFPLRVKANVYLSKHFALGINPNANLNIGQNSSIITINFIGQLKL